MKAYFAKKREVHELQRLGLTMWRSSEFLGGDNDSSASSSSSESSVTSGEASVGSVSFKSSSKSTRVSIPPRSPRTTVLCGPGSADAPGDAARVQQRNKEGIDAEAGAADKPQQAFLEFFQAAPGALRYSGRGTLGASPSPQATVLRADLAARHCVALRASQQRLQCKRRRCVPRASSAPGPLPTPTPDAPAHSAPAPDPLPTLPTDPVVRLAPPNISQHPAGTSPAETPEAPSTNAAVAQPAAADNVQRRGGTDPVGPPEAASITAPAVQPTRRDNLRRLGGSPLDGAPLQTAASGSQCSTVASAALPEESRKLIERAEAVLAHARSQTPVAATVLTSKMEPVATTTSPPKSKPVISSICRDAATVAPADAGKARSVAVSAGTLDGSLDQHVAWKLHGGGMEAALVPATDGAVRDGSVLHEGPLGARAGSAAEVGKQGAKAACEGCNSEHGTHAQLTASEAGLLDRVLCNV